MDNGCPVCGGSGRVLAFGLVGDASVIRCPECAGLRITPASAEDGKAIEPVPDNPPSWPDFEAAV